MRISVQDMILPTKPKAGRFHPCEQTRTGKTFQVSDSWHDGVGKIDDPELYHLVVNTDLISYISYESAAKFIGDAA
jgi:hypothetical protein